LKKGDAAGTSFYLELMDLSTSSFLEKNLLPLQRINRIWTAVFCLRYWRFWMKCDDTYTLSKNFVSSNTYLSVEINAHSLLLVIRKFRLDNTPELLLTWLFGSQQCEAFFRAIRSLCPVGLNKPNLTEGEFLDRARKADALLLLQQKGAEDGIVYRRQEKRKNRSGGTKEAMEMIHLPSDEEIAKELRNCQETAKEKMRSLGIMVDVQDKTIFSFDPVYGKRLRNNLILDDELQDDEEDTPLVDYSSDGDEPEDDDHGLQVLKSLHQASFRDFGETVDTTQSDPSELLCKSLESTNHQFVSLPDSDGRIRRVKKSTLCWFLESNIPKMSNDRLLRVRQLASFVDSRSLIVKKVEHRTVIRIGDWCLFKTLPDANHDLHSDLRHLRFLLGRVIQFKATASSSSSSSARIHQWEKGTKNVGVNCTWYRFDNQHKGSKIIAQRGTKLAVISHGFHPCETYICSLPPPEIPSEKTIIYSNDIVNDTRSFLSTNKTFS